MIMPQHLLHGILSVTICEVDRLHLGCNFDFLRKRTQNPGKKFLAQVKRCVLCRPEIVGTKLYATVDLDKARVGRTRTVEHETSHPRWSESFHIYCAHSISHVIFTVKDDNPIGATLIGRAYVPVEHVIKGFLLDRWVDILDEEHHPIRGASKIRVKMQYFSATEDKSWSQGIRNAQYPGVPFTYFNQRQGCRVTFYQDAHMPNDPLIPWIPLSGGKYYKHGKCWEDVFDAIINAKHFIYITGWSVYTEITLVRDPKIPETKGDKDNMTLGKLLKSKADQGITVLVLVWDDRTSDAVLKKDGLMATHDQETEEYFRNTNVHCVLCPRNPDGGRSVVQGFEVSTMFTHHQKAIVVDCEGPGGGTQMRRIKSFIGGIDLCDGRYDTYEHPLFATLNTVHYNDFHQPNFSGASIKKGGPREPWHDVHCQLEGPVAWDVLYNFEQRWEKQVGKQFLISRDKLDKIIVSPSAVTTSEDRDTWNVQLFRSIDGGAVGFPEDPTAAAVSGLISGKDSIIERSIQDAYIHAIRRAKNFIYIENQYFLGSSFGWKPSPDIVIEDINALHLIPRELSLKIVNKIEAGERFAVYIVIPMWPEGVPESGSVQAILDWQRRTMEMMYTDIVAALHRKGIQANPRDYLSFFCLGNREKKKAGEYVPPETPEPNTDYSRAQHSRRFMIYVHAKMMIVDDEYIIIGSANINQRSMDGARDTEIAMGAFQPHHLAAWGPPRGHIYGFRRALWYEHFGEPDDEAFNHPERLECIKLVNRIAELNWNLYAEDAVRNDLQLRVHLLRYPIEVNTDGTIGTLHGLEHFPDTEARILGTKSEILPPILTT